MKKIDIHNNAEFIKGFVWATIIEFEKGNVFLSRLQGIGVVVEIGKNRSKIFLEYSVKTSDKTLTTSIGFQSSIDIYELNELVNELLYEAQKQTNE